MTFEEYLVAQGIVYSNFLTEEEYEHLHEAYDLEQVGDVDEIS